MACPHLTGVQGEGGDGEAVKPLALLAKQLSECASCAVSGCPSKAGVDIWLCLHPTCGFRGCSSHFRSHVSSSAAAYASMAATTPTAGPGQSSHACAMRGRTGGMFCVLCDVDLSSMAAPACEADALHNDRVAAWGRAYARASARSPRVGRTVSVDRAGGVSSTTPTGAHAFALAVVKRDSVRPFLRAYPLTGGLTGLSNLGNTCFLNAALQALLNIPPFSVYMCECEGVSVRPDTGTAGELHSLAAHMWITSHKSRAGDDAPVLSPTSLLRTLRRVNPIFDGFAQQDAHEVWRTLLNDTHERTAVDMPMSLFATPMIAAETAVAAAHAHAGGSSDAVMHAAQSRGGEVASGSRMARVHSAGELHSAHSAGEPSPQQAHTLGRIPGVVKRSQAGSHVFMDTNSGADKETGTHNPARMITHTRVRPMAAPYVDGDATGEISITVSTKRPRLVEDAAEPSPASVTHAGSPHSHMYMREWLHTGPYTGGDTVSRSIVSDLFEGVLASNTRCRTCGCVSVSYEPFHDLSVPIPKRSYHAPATAAVSPAPLAIAHNSMRESTTAAVPEEVARVRPPWWTRWFCGLSRAVIGSGSSLDVRDALHAYCEQEVLTGTDAYACDVCGVKRDADKHVRIAALPEILCIHMKRFSYHGWGSKNSTTVSFPLTDLDMSPYMCASSPVSAATRAYVRACEQRSGLTLAHMCDASSGTDEDAPPPVPHHTSTSIDSGGTHTGGSDTGGAAAQSRARVTHSMSPEVRAWMLHRNALACGRTGVENVSAAVAAVAHTHTPVSTSPVSPVAVATHAASICPTINVGIPVPTSACVEAHTLGNTNYDCVAVVQHIGGINGGHYITHARNRITNKWYTYDDSIVSAIDEAYVRSREAYILIYARARQREAVAMPPRAPDDPTCVYISRYWWLRYTHMSAPGPISNADILCDHGAMKRTLAAQAYALTVCVTDRQYAALAASYGAAEAPLRDVSPCAACLQEAAALDVRRKREKSEIIAVDTTRLPEGSDSVWFLMSEWWLTRWRNFINNGGIHDGTGRGCLPPGPIDNARLVSKDGTPLPNTRSAIHYRGVNQVVWTYLHGIYGGGPELRRKTIDIYAEPV